MTSVPAWLERLRFLSRVAERAAKHLELTDTRLFAQPMTPQRIQALADDVLEGEQVDAFASRFGRLQDILGAKLLPRYLEAVGEPVGAMLENLDRAERLQLVPSADDWMAVRRLRNQMVHEYIESSQILCDALNGGHRFVPVLLKVNKGLHDALRARNWLDE